MITALENLCLVSVGTYAYLCVIVFREREITGTFQRAAYVAGNTENQVSPFKRFEKLEGCPTPLSVPEF